MQGPEHCHIDFCKRLAQCTNNKDVFACILRWHVRSGHLQYLRTLDVDAMEAEADGERQDAVDAALKSDSIPCELGIRYPTLSAIMTGKKNIQTTLVIFIYEFIFDFISEICYVQAHGGKTRAGRRGVTGCPHYNGKECLDIHLLKPARSWAEIAREHAVQEVLDAGHDGGEGQGEWVTYQYRAQHPILRWLPSKLAEWIGDNYGPQLGIPPKSHADGWTVAELNAILEKNLVGGTKGHLRTFGGIQWECEMYNGRPKARCYPFDLPKHRFRGKNPQVVLNSLLNSYMNCDTNSVTGLRVPDCTATIQSQPPGDLRSGNGLRHERGQSALVWSAAATVPVHPVPYRRRRQPPAPPGSVSGLLQLV